MAERPVVVRQDLAKDAGTALFWKALQQGGVSLIYLIRLLVLARLLTPDDFGLLAMAITAIAFLMSVTDFGMIPALVQRTEATDQHYDAAWTIGFLRALTVGATVFLAAPLIGRMFAEPRAVAVVQALSLLPLLEASASIKIAELIRDLRFRLQAVAKLFEALAVTVISIVLAQSWGVWALVFGTLAGPVVYTFISYILAPHRPRFRVDRAAARSLIIYGRWIFATGLIAISAAAILRAVISRELGAAELGLYFLAAKLAFLPNEIASQVMGGVAFPLYARLQGNIHEATKAFRTIFIATMLVLTPTFVLMVVLAPSITNHFLGAQWQGTVPLIQMLSLVGLIGLTGDAAVPLFKGLGQPFKFALLETTQSVLLIIFALPFVSSLGVIGAGYAWVAAITGTLVVSILFLRQTLRFPFRGTGKSLVAIALATAAGALTAIYIQHNFPSLLGFCLAALIAVSVTATVLWALNTVLELGFTKHFARAFPRTAPLLASFD